MIGVIRFIFAVIWFALAQVGIKNRPRSLTMELFPFQGLNNLV